ncbi:cytochrome b561 domain-containing protein [Nitratireductor sp. XY-223]|uniref:cytochrome b561 domain-containing protein n=1 Tax=Nitratireductor sp. XY-223 TaxID=2561926 RepID=UPI0010AAF9F0|nr:cytochrome b561 domain-containing protein [Nitratireductor sp. XY-223]
MIEWLLAPIDQVRLHEVGAHVSWHGRFMVLAWSFLFPLGIIIARFFKIMPRQDWPRHVDNQAWWVAHRVLQYGGGVVILAALWLIWQAPTTGEAGTLHRVFGWAVVILCAFQILTGVFRGSKGGPTDASDDGSLAGDHYDMTVRRKMFEHFHKSVGYLALFVACIATASGLWLANGPRWMWIATALWWALLIAVFMLLQRRGLAVDTYQAIWGPDESHPGNRMKPIGWGIVRRK